VPAKRLNAQVKRNGERFPADFLYQLTAVEVVTNCDHLRELKFSKVLPYTSTKTGAIHRGGCHLDCGTLIDEE
jgi:ORF6N domain